MRTINDESISIFDALNKIKENKYVIPAFQRQFVWNVYRIEKLWDSILLDYPFLTFLFWHIDDSNTNQLFHYGVYKRLLTNILVQSNGAKINNIYFRNRIFYKLRFSSWYKLAWIYRFYAISSTR